MNSKKYCMTASTKPVESACEKGKNFIPSRVAIESTLHIRGYAADFVERIVEGGPAGLTSRELAAFDEDRRREMNIAVNLMASLGLVLCLSTGGEDGEQFILSPTAVAALYGRKEYGMHFFRPYVLDGIRVKGKVLLLLSMERFWKYHASVMTSEMQAISDTVENALDIVRRGLVDDYKDYLDPPFIQVFLLPGKINIKDVMGEEERARNTISYS